MMDIFGVKLMLHNETCVPCQGGVPPLNPDEISTLVAQIGPAWDVVDSHHLRIEWSFPDFANALDFLNRAAEICELEGHHADFELSWGRVQAIIYTHKIDGLTQSDFVLAAKFDQL